VVRLKNENNVELKLKNGRHLLTNASRLKPYLVPAPKKTFEFKSPPEQDSNPAPNVNDGNQETEPPFPPPWTEGLPQASHRYHLRGLAPPGEQSGEPVPLSRQPSFSATPSMSRAPSLTRAPSVTRAPSLARTVSRPHTPAPTPQGEPSSISPGDATFAASAYHSPVQKRGRGRPAKLAPSLPPLPEETPREQGGVLSENAENVENIFAQTGHTEREQDEWVLVMRKKKRKQHKGSNWSKTQQENFRLYGDIYRPYHAVFPPVAIPPAVPPLPPPPHAPVPAAAPPPVAAPLPVVIFPHLLDDGDDDDVDDTLVDDDSNEYETIDEDSDEADVDDEDDDATVILGYPGANSPLPHTGYSSDELDQFDTVPNTPVRTRPPSPNPATPTPPLPSTSSGAPTHPLPLTPKQEKFLGKVLGPKAKRKAPVTPKQHQLRSKGGVSESSLPDTFRKKKK